MDWWPWLDECACDIPQVMCVLAAMLLYFCVRWVCLLFDIDSDASMLPKIATRVPVDLILSGPLLDVIVTY